MSMPRAVRHINEARLLTALLHDGPQSRADLARTLGLTRSTAGNLIAGLEDIGLVTAHGQDKVNGSDGMARDAGRPGALFTLRGEHSYFLGMELGVGYLRSALMDLNGAIVARHSVIWAHDAYGCHATAPDPDWLARRIAAATRQILEGVPPETPSGAADRLRGVCISVPGLVAGNGVVLRAPKLCWSNVPLLSLLRDHMPDVASISIENDANAFALSLMGDLRAKGIRDALFFWIETGVGGAIMCNGTLIRGAHGFAGEFGHLLTGAGLDMLSSVDGPERMEDVVGLDGVLADRHLRTAADPAGRMMTIERFLARVARNDPDAVSRLDRWSTSLAAALATLSSALDPHAIYLGGPGARLFLTTRDQVLDRLRGMQLTGSPMPRIMVSDLGEDAPSLGCAMMLHEQYLAIDESLVFGKAGRIGVA